MTAQQTVEIFHLLFLRHLGERLSKEHYALKGGCNLRFYLKSIRYSEDLDLDVKIVAKNTLMSNVRKVFESPSFVKTLHSKGITISHVSEPKQTETTQRWKVTLQTPKNEIPIHTKIEFSRRNLEPGTSFEAVDPELVHSYGLYPIFVNHYDRHAAFRQKIGALIHRTETQARDLFDLELLLGAGAEPSAPPRTGRELLTKAQDNARSVTYENFTGQVLAYLLPEFRSLYTEKVWNKTLEKVIELLERLKS